MRRSDEYANSPLTLGMPSARVVGDRRPRRGARSRAAGGAASARGRWSCRGLHAVEQAPALARRCRARPSSTSAVRSSAPSTTPGRRRAACSTGAAGRARAPRPGRSMPAWSEAVEAPERDVGAACRARASRARRRGRGSARRRSWPARAPRAPSAPRGRRAAARRAAPGAARRPARPTSFDAAPSTPRPTGAPARSRSRTGAMPAPSRALELGQCATPVPVSPKRATSASSRWTQCASHTSSPSQPSSSRYSTGRTPKRSRQNASSSSVSARCVCSRTPRRRASSRGLGHQLAA